jgi:23S rRNA (pseudouridine1915-N3)-methyltransferase
MYRFPLAACQPGLEYLPRQMYRGKEDSVRYFYLCPMKIKFICIGKTGKSFLEEGEKEYLTRLKHYVSIERIEIADIRNAKSLTKDQIKAQEGKEILSKLVATDLLILLDERGEQFSSVSFSKFIQQKFNSGGRTLVFSVGGAYGFSDEIYQRANGKISLSSMTFSHQMVRMIFFEQLYRAMTILKGEPYHHE